jgi:hypothetical protein
LFVFFRRIDDARRDGSPSLDCIIATFDCAAAPYGVTEVRPRAGARDRSGSREAHTGPTRSPRGGGGALAGWYRCVVTTPSPSTRHAVHRPSVGRVQITHSPTAKPAFGPDATCTGEKRTLPVPRARFSRATWYSVIQVCERSLTATKSPPGHGPPNQCAPSHLPSSSGRVCVPSSAVSESTKAVSCTTIRKRQVSEPR